MTQTRDALAPPGLSQAASVATNAAALSGWFDATQIFAPGALTTRAVQGGVHIEAPGLRVLVDPRRVQTGIGPDALTLSIGRPLLDGTIATAQRIAERIRRQGTTDWSWLRGRFSVVHVDLHARLVCLVTDRFAVHPLCFRQEGGRIAFSDRADSVPASAAQAIDLQAIFNYVYFHVIPAPRTIYRGVTRLEGAQCVRCDRNGSRSEFWWRPRFETSHESLDSLKPRFLELLDQAVRREATTDRIGSFLSGGTDSSTVAGILRRMAGRATPTFSIGFDAAGYDEIAYARIAARHFSTEQHEYYVTPDDLVRGIARVAAQYDQPFGNSSALPAYYCGTKAREAGIEKLLAGDGGDELFGGNSRYAKQKVFDVYYRLPASLRTGIVEPLLVGQNWPARIVLLKKLASYVRQAKVPMPDRMETYNLLDRFGPATVFTERFLGQVRSAEPMALQREVYGRQREGSLVDRMLAYDWRFTLGDNDLPKVTGTAQLAGVDVGFPLLDDDLVDFSTALAPDLKVRGLVLRFFFKEALRGFLPDEIIRKRKHGFGLPFGAWLVRDEPLRRLAQDALAAVAERGIIRHDLARELFSVRLQEHAGYFGEMIWILMILEQWLKARFPRFAV